MTLAGDKFTTVHLLRAFEGVGVMTTSIHQHRKYRVAPTEGILWQASMEGNLHVGVLLGIRQGESDPPRAPKQQPLLDVEMLTQQLVVVYECLCVVVLQASQRTGCTTATLIHQHNLPVLGIKEAPATPDQTTCGTPKHSFCPKRMKA